MVPRITHCSAIQIKHRFLLSAYDRENNEVCPSKDLACSPPLPDQGSVLVKSGALNDHALVKLPYCKNVVRIGEIIKCKDCAGSGQAGWPQTYLKRDRLQRREPAKWLPAGNNSASAKAEAVNTGQPHHLIFRSTKWPKSGEQYCAQNGNATEAPYPRQSARLQFFPLGHASAGCDLRQYKCFETKNRLLQRQVGSTRAKPDASTMR